MRNATLSRKVTGALACISVVLALALVAASVLPTPASPTPFAPEGLVGFALMGALNIYDTAVLNRVVQELDEPASYLLDTLFTQVEESETERIYFDLATRKNRITPLVSPLVPGKVVTEPGFTTRDFAPAYAKDKRVFTPQGALKRMAGEKIGGSLSPAERQQARLRVAMEDQLQMLTTREEVMASEVLRTGKITVSGEGYATQLIDFQRDAALTVTLAGNDRWSIVHADSNPVEDLETWATTVHQKSGAAVIGYIMDPDAWKNFRTRLVARSEAQLFLDFARSGDSVAQMGPFARGQGNAKAKQVARIGTFDIWVYNDVYIDDAGNATNLLPSGTVLAVTDAVDGVRHYGLIQDEKAGLKSTRYFVKSWLEEDPPVRWLLLQAAPLVVPYRVNATFCATVL